MPEVTGLDGDELQTLTHCSNVFTKGGFAMDGLSDERWKMRKILAGSTAMVALLLFSATWAAKSYGGAPPKAALKSPVSCSDLPDGAKLRSLLIDIVKQGKDANTAIGNHEWAALVGRDGLVCAIVFSGSDRDAEWPGSRVVAAEKASIANALSSPDLAVSTANLYFAAQPGQSSFSLTTIAPPNPAAAYGGDAEAFGQSNDPMLGKPIGGVIVFGGGLPLYERSGRLLGGLGLSGDTACTDHFIAWKLRHALALDAVPAGVAPNSTDDMIPDLQNADSPSGFGHPTCKGGKPSDDVIDALPQQLP